MPLQYVLIPLLILLTSLAEAQAPNKAVPQNPDQAKTIMEKVDEVSRLSFHASFSKLQLSTCRFGKKGKKIVCIEPPRQKELESVQKQFGENLKDSKAISIVLNPASERGIGMLTYQYDEPGKDTESWLYLSALGKVKRMISGSEDEQEPVSFFGSEFTTEDMETGKTHEFTYRIKKQSTFRQRPVWVIEAMPNDKRLRKTRYGRLVLWVDQERFVILKSQIYDKRDLLFKHISAKNIVEKNGIWLARDITIINQQTQRLSHLSTKELALGVMVSDDFLTQRSLTDFAFRERELSKLRRFIE